MAIEARSQGRPEACGPVEKHAAPGLPGAIRQKRLIWQLLDYWETKRGARAYPSLDDIEPDEISDLWPHCFVLDVKNFKDFPYFHYLGPRLARYSGVFLSGKHDWSRTLLKKSVCHYKEALQRRAPVLVEEDLIQYDNRHLLFRSVLLPLSDDGATINFLLGAANGKIQKEGR